MGAEEKEIHGDEKEEEEGIREQTSCGRAIDVALKERRETVRCVFLLSREQVITNKSVAFTCMLER
eukprot:109008-Hanusia_phi.AAC.4